MNPVCVVIVSLLLIPMPLCSLVVALTVMSIDVGVVGYMTMLVMMMMIMMIMMIMMMMMIAGGV